MQAGRNSQLSRMQRSIATLRPHHPNFDKHQRGACAKPIAAKRLVWLRSGPWACSFGMDQACIDRGVDIQQLRREGTRKSKQPFFFWPCCPQRSPKLPSTTSRLINTPSSSCLDSSIIPSSIPVGLVFRRLLLLNSPSFLRRHPLPSLRFFSSLPCLTSATALALLYTVYHPSTLMHPGCQR